MDLIREKLTQAEELILQLIAFEKIKAFSTDKIRDAYDAAFSAFNKLREDIALKSLLNLGPGRLRDSNDAALSARSKPRGNFEFN